jgi:hypothetical protein
VFYRLLGAVLVSLALLLGYANRVVFDADAFADRSAMSLEDARVGDYLGARDTSGVPWYHPAFEVMQETPYHFESPDEFSCAPNRGGTAGSLFQINHWIDTTPAPKPSNAEIVNARAFLLARARRCQKERGRLPNLLAVDFAMSGDVVGAAAELNARAR